MRHYLVSGIEASHFPVRTNRQHKAIFILEISLLSSVVDTCVVSASRFQGGGKVDRETR